MSYALNYLNNPIQGCSSGITVWQFTVKVTSLFFSQDNFFLITKTPEGLWKCFGYCRNRGNWGIYWVFKSCGFWRYFFSLTTLSCKLSIDSHLVIHSVIWCFNFAVDYLGIPCVVDDNCTAFTGVCMPSKKCEIDPLDIVRHYFCQLHFLWCFVRIFWMNFDSSNYSSWKKSFWSVILRKCQQQQKTISGPPNDFNISFSLIDFFSVSFWDHQEGNLSSINSWFS